MKTPLLLLFTTFALLFAPFATAQDSLGSALDSLRAAEQAAGEKDRDEDFDEEDDFDEDEDDWDELLDAVTDEEVKQTLQQHFKTELGWLKKVRGEEPELAEEGREMIEHAARETVVIAEHEPEELPFHLRTVKSEIALEYWSYELFEGDDPKKAAAEYKKARKALIEVEVERLEAEIKHLREEIKEIREFEAAEIDAEVEEMLLEREE